MDRSDPFDDLEAMLDALTGEFAGTGEVPVEVADTGEAFVVVADLPGYDADALDVTLADATTLAVSAERDVEAIEGAETYLRRERTASVSRTISLPEPVDEGGTEASLEDGVLTVTLPKRVGTDEGTDIPVN